MAASIVPTVLAAGLALSAILVAHDAVAEPPVHVPAAAVDAPDPYARLPVEAFRAATAATVVYEWPTGHEAPVVRAFDRPEAPWASGHRGVDLELVAGEQVHAAADGVVVFAGVVVDRPVVSVRHADGVRTTYEPVTAAVAAGDTVAGGQPIGTLAAGGHCAACLHWGARRDPDDYLDPLSLLSPDVVIRLLPARR